MVAKLSVQDGGSSQQPSQQVDAPPTKSLPTWSYESYEDEMGKGNINYAILNSLNTVNFSSPYDGPQQGTLTIRKSKRLGKSILFNIQKGQIHCSSYDGCSVLIRFDDEPSSTFHASEPSDNSSETIFISNYDGFIKKLTKSKRVRISVEFFQEGSHVFEFDVSGFNQDAFNNAHPNN